MKNVLLTILLIYSFNLFAQDQKPFIHCDPVYIIIADTSGNYDELNSKMMELSKKLNKEVDTTKKYYKEKDIIGLKNQKDPLLNGKYVRRSSLGRTLSIEYMNCYDSTSTEPELGALELLDDEVSGTTMFILVGIYAEPHLSTAKEDLQKVQEILPDAYMTVRHDLICYWVRQKQ